MRFRERLNEWTMTTLCTVERERDVGDYVNNNNRKVHEQK